MSTLGLSLLPAIAADVPVIAQINRVAYFPEDYARFQNPESDLIKALNTSFGEIFGFGCLTHVAAQQAESGAQIAAAPPPHINIELIKYVSAEVSKLEGKVKDVEHFGQFPIL
ncbi:MAG: hypothetical protein Q9207_003076 [Kuettlingeria erythrocarpa]